MNYNFQKTANDIAKIIDGNLIGSANTLIDTITGIENSNNKPTAITFISSSEYAKYMDNCNAACVIIPIGFAAVPKPNQAFIEVANPYISMVNFLKYIVSLNKTKKTGEIHRSCIIATTSKIAKTARIGARCTIGDNCIIADNVIIHPHTVLYDNVIIGNNTEIHSNVVCYNDTVIGKNCIIHAGAIIGADGFGFIENKDGSYEKIPQLGNVIIGDNVEIGANTTIDRALLDSTIISDGVKIDNLVHIAHNCNIDVHSAMAAQVGVSGSTKIGKRNRIGGQVGVAGHLNIADDVILTAQSGVSKSIQEKGIYFGSPAKERMQAFKIEAYLRKLPDIAVDVEMLKKYILKDSNTETENS